MKPEKKRVSILLETAVLDKIKELAQQDFRSLSGYVNRLLKEHLNSLDTK